MPTDDIAATRTPPVDEHESPLAGRSICPPEEMRIQSSHITTMAPSSHNAHDDDDAPLDAPAQQPTPPPNDDPASPTRTPSPSESHPKPVDSPVQGPTRDIPTPMSAVDDLVEEPRHTPASPLSATAPLTASWPRQRYAPPPYPSHRVCTATLSQ